MGLLSTIFAYFLSFFTRGSDEFFPTRDGFFARVFTYASFVQSRTTDASYADVSKKVIKSQRVQDAIRRAASDDFNKFNGTQGYSADKSRQTLQQAKEKHKSRAIHVLQEMRSCISSSLLRIAGWILYKLLSRVLSTIQVHKGQMEILRKASQRNVPMIYLPMHRSHLDYILISFILYMYNIKPPLVAAGDNLLIPFFGNLMRGLGAFFIKRKLDPKDTIYRAVLQAYMIENLKEGHSLEFFVEGGRSRSGKACMPKAGLLSIVVDSVLEGAIEDVYIVPVGISYEKIMDGSFVGEQLGRSKVAESFSLAAKAIWSKLHSTFGNVRVDFCQPFSLKEYMRATNMYSSNLKSEYSLPCAACTPDISSLMVSNDTSGNTIDMIIYDDKRQVISDFAKHVVFDAFNNSALMSSQILSFLFLTKYRKGATLHQLTQSLTWIRDELKNRRRDVGFSGESADVVKYACNILGKELVSSVTFHTQSWSSQREGENNNMRIVYLQPTIKLPHVLELQYYSNACTSVFLLDSVVVNAMFALLETELDVLTGSEYSNQIVTKEPLLSKALELCDILQREFIFTPPCTTLSDAICATIESFITDGLIVEAEERKPIRRNRQYDFDDDDDDGYFNNYRDDEYKVVLTTDVIETLQFYRSILGSFVESYWIAACSLINLVNKQKEESVFFKEILDIAKERSNQGLLCYEESIAADSLRNAMKLFESKDVIEVQRVNSVNTFHLSKKFDNRDAVSELVLSIEQFKK
ncbi:Glycerol-3-phosphate acyltransferase 1-like protein [Leptotrombidium deliense]|uniref:Glycerol-3-phosphate acyltransferase 1-like protein n=1 Tax=Leptotrombidium deliense TaxID=299467 RepID=A0A443SV19_9ACAR|nr:Glycerol-3-phosphate acyltransferase 1-like protein [Leptotrombidium deliense]